MKLVRKTVAVFMLLFLIFSLAACKKSNAACEHNDGNSDGVCDNCSATLEAKKEECKKHKDDDEDNVCDVCKKELEKKPLADEMVLISDSEPLFRFVTYAKASTDTLQTLREIVAAYSDAGIDIEIITEQNNSEFDGIEILVGPVQNRGENYIVDIFTLGKDGYMFEAIDDKIILTSGDHSTMSDAILKFFKDYLDYKDSDDFEAPENVTVKSSEWKTKIQDNYKITSFKIVLTPYA